MAGPHKPRRQGLLSRLVLAIVAILKCGIKVVLTACYASGGARAEQAGDFRASHAIASRV